MVEHEGEGQLAFEADNGVPDRAHRRPGVVGNRTYSRPVTNTEGKKKISIVWVVLILAVIVYQAIQFLIG